jgi:hypothetical protein
VSDYAKHAKQPHLGDVVSQFEAKPFARLLTFGCGDNWTSDLGPLPSRE